MWDVPTTEPIVYPSFDDGPHPTITPWVLDQLMAHNAKATFFCIGKNIEQYPNVYKRIIEEGHAVGNHTQNHLNGWKTSTPKYLDNIAEATKWIDSPLFRPPYGRIRSKQADKIKEAMKRSDAKIVMWDVLSADFDQEITSEQCVKNVLDNTTAGSIIVFHDSEKAFANLSHALRIVLKELTNRGYRFEKL